MVWGGGKAGDPPPHFPDSENGSMVALSHPRRWWTAGRHSALGCRCRVRLGKDSQGLATGSSSFSSTDYWPQWFSKWGGKASSRTCKVVSSGNSQTGPIPPEITPSGSRGPTICFKYSPQGIQMRITM